jgi:hypothetical protein
MKPKIWTCGSFGLVMLMLVSSAMAQSRTQMLKGDFAFSGSGICVNSPATFFPAYQPPAGFTADLRPLGFSFVSSFSFEGVHTLNGDGTGSTTAKSVGLLGHPGAVNVAENSSQFTYSVAADRTLTIDYGPQHGVSVAGPGVGQENSISNISLVGHVSSDGRSLTIASFDPRVETVTRLVPAPELVVSVRICHRTQTGVRISRTPGAGGLGDD